MRIVGRLPATGDGDPTPGHTSATGEGDPTPGHTPATGKGDPTPGRTPGAAPLAAAAVAALPLLLLLGSVLIGGGPKTVSDDVALLVLRARDALHGGVLVGPYSRYGWHHPGPSYFYLLALPVWLWHGAPTGLYVAVPLLAAVCAAGMALLLWRAAGAAAGWVGAAAVSLVVAGLGASTVRDPWNPYVVAVPALLSLVASALAAAGAPGALAWAAVAGSFAVQTHVSTAPVVGGAFAVAVVVRLVRWALRGRRWPEWRRPELWVAGALLIGAWAPPLWDQAFGTGNLHSIWRFFTASHPTHAWSDAWRTVAAVCAATVFQHHGALAEGAPARHPVVLTVLYCAVAGVGIGVGLARRRMTAVSMGVFALLAGGLAVLSVTRIVGPILRYLVVWMAVLPALPLIAAVVALAPERVRWRSPAAAVLAVVVVLPFGLALRSVAEAPPAASLTDHDIQAAYRLVAPVVGPPGAVVRIEITDGGRWPAAAGVGLELVRHGHPIRVQPPWPLLFGDNRRATGTEPVAVVVAGVDPRTWPPAAQATMLGRAGPEYLFVRRPAP